VTSARTLCKGIDSQFPRGVLRQVLQGDLGLALSDHEMHDDQALEDNGPRRVAQAVLKGAKDLGDACFAGMRRDEDGLDILRLGGRELWDGSARRNGQRGWCER
jgi:hypothetical protein